MLEDRRQGREQFWLDQPVRHVFPALPGDGGGGGLKGPAEAQALQEPRLRQRRRMDIFRQQLMACLLALYCRPGRPPPSTSLRRCKRKINVA